MKIIKITFDGTAEELKAAAHLFEDPQPAESAGDMPGQEPTVAPQDAIRKMLTRLPVSNGQLAVYKALGAGRLEYTEFLKATGRTSGVMAGVMGALGRRINNTKEIHLAGLPGNTSAVLKWEKENGKGYFTLTPDAVEALKAEGII